MKKRFASSFLLIALILVFLPPPAAAVAAVQTNFDDFWIKFKGAISRKDKNKVTEMVNYPFETYAYDKTIKTKNKTAFLKIYKQIFDGEVDAKKCFANARPHREMPKRYVVSCAFRNASNVEKPFGYNFEQTKTGWKLVSFENVNE